MYFAKNGTLKIEFASNSHTKQSEREKRYTVIVFSGRVCVQRNKNSSFKCSVWLKSERYIHKWIECLILLSVSIAIQPERKLSDEKYLCDLVCLVNINMRIVSKTDRLSMSFKWIKTNFKPPRQISINKFVSTSLVREPVELYIFNTSVAVDQDINRSIRSNRIRTQTEYQRRRKQCEIDSDSTSFELNK